MVFVLPNLDLNQGNRDTEPLTLGLDGIAIVPTSDQRVSAVRSWSTAADRFLSAFHDGHGRAIGPAVLVARTDWMDRFAKDPEPVIAFRNAVAMSAVLLARARGPGGSWLGASWSDSFDYHPAQLRLDGSKFDLHTPALNSTGLQLENLSITPDLGLPRNRLGQLDNGLGLRLGRVWRRRYLKRRSLRTTARVFRSLEIAYQAASVGFKNYSSLTEVGMDAVYWANAIEVLAMPPTGDVSKWDSVRLLGSFEWLHEPELRKRKYWARRGKERTHMNLAQRLFLHLYSARSKFVHGDTVSENLLLPYGPEAPSILSLASTLYRTALFTVLEANWPWKPSLNQSIAMSLGARVYHRHLLAVTDDEEWF